MTRRILVFKDKQGEFHVSQEFNGDRQETEFFGLYNHCTVNWQNVRKMFDGVTTLDAFEKTLEQVETDYGYNHVKPIVLSKIPICEEVWEAREGKLILIRRYDESVLERLKRTIEEYSFKAKYVKETESYQYGQIQKPGLSIFAKNTDGKQVTWFTIIPDFNGEPFFKGNDTDCTNIWLYETRPDLTPEKIEEMFMLINYITGADDDHCIAPKDFVDPEDWQEIANIQDADTDTRYTEAKNH